MCVCVCVCVCYILNRLLTQKVEKSENDFIDAFRSICTHDRSRSICRNVQEGTEVTMMTYIK